MPYGVVLFDDVILNGTLKRKAEATDGVDTAKNYTVELLVHRPDDVAGSNFLPLDHPEIVAAREQQG